VPPEGGDPHILNLPAHSKGLGQGVATDGYGKPSQVRGQCAAPPEPGPDADAQSSVSFAPLQSCSASSRPAACTSSATTRAGGTSTPSKHRLMINGSDDKLVKSPKVFTWTS
jgi:sulfane dehydrogenase subunit SoxC